MTTGSARGGTLAAALVMVAVALARFAPLAACAGDCIVDFKELHGANSFASHLLAADVYLNSWILAWDAHALFNAPGELFHGNVLHPARNVLTGSEHMLGTAIPLAPLTLVGADAVLLHRISMLAAATLTGLTTFALVRWLCGSPWAALTAGILAVLSPWRISELSHVQLLSTSGFALAWLLSMRVLLEGARPLRMLALFAVLTLQFLSSYYLAFYLCASLAVILFSSMIVGRARRESVVIFLGIWFAALAVLAAASAPYLARGIGEVVALQGGRLPDPGLLRALAGTSPSFALPWSPLLIPGAPYAVPALWLLAAFATLIPRNDAELVLARALADDELADELYTDGTEPQTRRVQVARLALWLCVGLGIVMAIGARIKVAGVLIPMPAALAALVLPGFENLRAPLRWEILTALAIPVLAGLGLFRVQTRLYLRHNMAAGAKSVHGGPGAAQDVRQSAARAGVFEILVLILLCANVSWQALPTRPAWAARDDHAQAYRALSELTPAPTVEIPWPTNADYDAELSAAYMTGAARHWFPLLNGYTAYMPSSYNYLRRIAADLPAKDAVDRLVALSGLSWALVHTDLLSEAELQAWRSAVITRTAAEAWRGNNAVIYQLYSAEESGRLIQALLARDVRPHTFDGLLRSPLELSQVSGSLDVRLPASIRLFEDGRLNYRLPLRVHNSGGSDWPGFDTDPEGLVHIHYVLQRIGNSDQGETALGAPISEAVPIDRDVRAGQKVLVKVALQAHVLPGRYKVSFGLIQRIGKGWRRLPIEPAIAIVNLDSAQIGDPEPTDALP